MTTTYTKAKVKTATKRSPNNTGAKLDVAPEKQRYQHLVAHQAKPGQALNPKGRPKGSRNKLSESFVADMLTAWEERGPEAIAWVARNDPSTFLRVVAGLVPKEFSLKDNREQSLEKFFDQFTDEQLAEFSKQARAVTISG